MFAASSRSASRTVRCGGRAFGPDLVGLVGFHTSGFALVPPCAAFDHRLQEAVGNLSSYTGPGTNLTAGLRAGLTLLGQAPPGYLRRLWLLTDGRPNVQVDGIFAAVVDARAAWVNINTIGFGDSYDRSLLERVAAGTHRGRFVPVQSLRELTDALLADPRPPRASGRWHHRAEVTVLALDLSPSMLEPMERRTKLAVVQEAVTRLLSFKQHCFS
jgi:von Willebrand factor type A domain